MKFSCIQRDDKMMIKKSDCSKNIALALGLVMSLTAPKVFAQTIVIGSLVAGQVSKVYVSEGQQVKAGQKLLDLDSARYQAKLKFLQADVTQSRLKMDDAKIELDQAMDLFDRTVSSRRSLDAAKLAYGVAQAEYDKAQAAVDMHKTWKKYVNISAPVKATVSKILTPSGSTVFKENTPMIELTTD